MSNLGIRVSPLSYQTIEQIATAIRSRLKVQGQFPAHKLEYILQVLSHDQCVFGVRDDIKEEGLTLLNGSAIYLNAKVYDKLIKHDPRARFTAMHELSHFILHCNRFCNIAYCKANEIEAYCNPEWQADALAGAILCPAFEIIASKADEREVTKQYRVSKSCARKRLLVIKEKLQ